MSNPLSIKRSASADQLSTRREAPVSAAPEQRVLNVGIDADSPIPRRLDHAATPLVRKLATRRRPELPVARDERSVRPPLALPLGELPDPRPLEECSVDIPPAAPRQRADVAGKPLGMQDVRRQAGPQASRLTRVVPNDVSTKPTLARMPATILPRREKSRRKSVKNFMSSLNPRRVSSAPKLAMPIAAPARTAVEPRPAALMYAMDLITKAFSSSESSALQVEAAANIQSAADMELVLFVNELDRAVRTGLRNELQSLDPDLRAGLASRADLIKTFDKTRMTLTDSDIRNKLDVRAAALAFQGGAEGGPSTLSEDGAKAACGLVLAQSGQNWSGAIELYLQKTRAANHEKLDPKEHYRQEQKNYDREIGSLETAIEDCDTEIGDPESTPDEVVHWTAKKNGYAQSLEALKLNPPRERTAIKGPAILGTDGAFQQIAVAIARQIAWQVLPELIDEALTQQGRQPLAMGPWPDVELQFRQVKMDKFFETNPKDT